MIGIREYNNLKSQIDLTDEEIVKIKEYEDTNGITAMREKTNAYFEKVYSIPKKHEIKIDYDSLRMSFATRFKIIYGKQFIFEKDYIPLFAYMSKSEMFYKSPNLITELEITGNTISLKPSLSKGIMLVGGVGIGKSSMMDVFSNLFKSTFHAELFKDYYFKIYSANKIVEMYEDCETPGDKKIFWKKMMISSLCIDDPKTERMASNYGKANLIKDIVEKRYEKQLKTHIIMNYKEGYDNNVGQSIVELGEKYGRRFFDRVFEMFNIIHLNLKSKRQ